MQKTVKLRTAILIAALASIIVGSAVAAILMTRQIQNTFTMGGVGNFVLVREDDLETVVTSIAWGNFVPLQSKNSSAIIGTRICIKNLGNLNLKIAWNATGLDRGEYNITATSAGQPWAENFYDQFSIAPGNYNGYVIFYLTSLNPYAPPVEDGSFTINFNAVQNV